MSTKNLFIQALRTLFIGVVGLAALILLPAGTLNYWQAWVFIAVFMGVILVFGTYFAIKDPKLIERRQQVGPAAEQRPEQKIIASLAIV